MYSAVSVIMPPAIEPVTIDEARLHCRIDTTDDDPVLEGLIQSAREWTELYLNRALITQTLQVVLAQSAPQSGWPYLNLTAPLFVLPQWFNFNLLQQGSIQLPRAPIQSVGSVAVGQWGQPDQVLVAGTDYNVDITMQPGRVQLGPTALLGCQDHVAITFTAGYGAASSDMPRSIRTAILLQTAYLYEHRGDDDAGDAPTIVERLLAPHRLVTFG